MRTKDPSVCSFIGFSIGYITRSITDIIIHPKRTVVKHYDSIVDGFKDGYRVSTKITLEEADSIREPQCQP